METKSATGDGPNNAAYVTREDILNFPFPYKLWLVINLDFCDFLRWNRDGTVVLLDLVTLDDYLISTRSIFRIKNRSIFLQHLEEFKFERLNIIQEAEEDILLQYRHESFQRHRLDMLANVRRFTYQTIGDYSDRSGTTAAPSESITINNRRVADRMLGDLCFMLHGCLSRIQKSRLRFQTLFNFQNETRILCDKLKASDEKAARNRRTKGAVTSARSSYSVTDIDDDQIIEVSADLFENPHDSVLNLGDDIRPEYAGYYGNCSKDIIVSFFGEYLPMYEDDSMEIRKIIADNSTTNYTNDKTTSGNSEFLSEPSYSGNLEPKSELNSETGTFQSITNATFSSTLQPIFKTENEQDTSLNSETNVLIFPQNIPATDAEDDISMEEFIKFKDPLAFDSNDDVENKEELETFRDTNKKPADMLHSSSQERFPQMPADIKLEIEEDSSVENEANFRNFFSQYRASLNLLYDRH